MDCFIKQIQEKDCAFACLKMLFVYLSNNKNYFYLPQNLTKEVYSLWDIKKIAEAHNVKLEGVKIKNLNENIDFEKEPFLALIKESNGKTHMVFVRKTYKNKLLIYDPSIGKIKMTKTEFLSLWTGIYLKLIESKIDKKYKINNKLLNNKMVYLTSALQLISASLLMAGFYFVNTDSYFIIPLTFILGFVLLSFITNILTKRSSKSFDQKFSKLLDEYDVLNVRDKYETVLDYKSMLFSSPGMFISNFLILISSITILLINNSINLITIPILIILTFLDYFIFYKIKDKYESKSRELEKDINNDNDGKIFKNIYFKLSKISDKFGSFLMARKYVIHFIIFSIVFVLMAVSNTISLNFLVFNFLIYEMIYDSLFKTLSFDRLNEELKLLKVKFVSLIKY